MRDSDSIIRGARQSQSESVSSSQQGDARPVDDRAASGASAPVLARLPRPKRASFRSSFINIGIQYPGDESTSESAVAAARDEPEEPEPFGLAQALIVLITIVGLVYQSSYYAPRWLGGSHDQAQQIAAIAACAFVASRCALALTVLHNDIMAVSR